MRILLLSAYDAGSHAYWRQSLADMLPEWQWHSLTLPPRHFSWRVRGNAAYWALREREVLESGWDLLIATSMVDLATLRGLVPALAAVPTLYYFHENQFAFPVSPRQKSSLEAQMVSLYGAMAADAVAFNSAYNRSTFLRGCEALWRRLPDFTPPELPQSLAAKSEVLPVPLAPASPGAPSRARLPWRASGPLAHRPLRLIWCGRQEYDRGGEGLERILQRLSDADLDFELALVGAVFRERPAVFDRIEARWAGQLAHIGWLPAAQDYRALLASGDLVLSTTLHEFQGVAVMEAVQRGCVPVLPRRLAYPEIYPDNYLYAASEDPDTEAAAGAEHILVMAACLRDGDIAAPDLQAWEREALRPRYRSAVLELTGRG